MATMGPTYADNGASLRLELEHWQQLSEFLFALEKRGKMSFYCQHLCTVGRTVS